MNGIKTYFTGMINEMKAVSWPAKTQVWDYTKITLGMSLVLIVFIFASDQALNKLLELVLKSI